MKEYSYRGVNAVMVVVNQIGGVAILLVATIIGGSFLIQGFLHPQSLMTVARPAIPMIAIGWFVGLLLINLHPTVWLDDDGLAISAFFFAHIQIKWADVIDVGARQPLWSITFGTILVRARRITAFHRLYSMIYAWRLSPAFLIHKQIEGYDELLNEIRGKVSEIHQRQIVT